MNRNDFKGSKGWAFAAPRLPGEDRVGRDDSIIGAVSPRHPAYTTSELAWTAFEANRAVAAADRAWLIQDSGKPKLVLVLDLDIADRLSIRKARDWRQIPRKQGDQGSRS